MLSLMNFFPMIYFLYILIPLGPLVYIFIKWWSNKEAKPVDPNLGIKVITYYFKTIGYQISMIGISLMIANLIKGNIDSSGRTGAGILICGGLVYLIHLLIIKKFFDDTEFTITKRVYSTFNIVFVGLVVIVSMIVWLSIMLGEMPVKFETPLAFFIVYFIAWIFQSRFFYKPLFSKEK